MPTPRTTGDTTCRSANGADDQSTASWALPSISVDGYCIRSLWATVRAVGTKVHTNGIAGAESGKHTHADSQTATGSSIGKAFRFFPPTVPRVRTATLHATQEWEGRVIEIGRNEFEARLLDLTSGDDVAREVATIPLQEVDAEDRALMREGSIFRWVIGHERSVDGTRRRVSRIVFLDPPRLTERDLKKGREWAAWLRQGWGAE